MPGSKKLPFHSFSSRLVLMYLLLFFASFLILFGILFLSTQHDQRQQLEAEILLDAQAFADRYALFGINGVIRLLSNRVQSVSTKQAPLYVLRGKQGQILAGTLDSWPVVERLNDNHFSITQPAINGSKQEYLARSLALPFGGELLIGRSTHALTTARNRLLRIFSLGVLITLALGWLGGMVISKRAVRRIEQINHLCRKIIDGDFSSRIEADPNGDDLDQLSSNINEMLDRIESLMQDITQVSDNVAHDLRTPLSHLRNRLESAALLLRHDSAATHEINGAISDTDSLLETFNALLRIAKIESGQKKAAFETIDVAQIAADVIEMYEPLAEEKQQTINAELHASAIIHGDKNLLFQALANLLDNAIKYTPEGGNISLRQQANEQVIELQICDSGPGIPDDKLEQVSKRFYRLEQSRSTPGNGLGLSLVKAIAKLHQGELTLLNSAKGFCVTISLKR